MGEKTEAEWAGRRRAGLEGAGVGCELKIKTGVFRGFGGEVVVNGAGDGGVDGGDAFGGGSVGGSVGGWGGAGGVGGVGAGGLVGVGDLDEGNDVADFGFDVGAVAVFLGGITAEDGGGALELAEGFADGGIAAA